MITFFLCEKISYRLSLSHSHFLLTSFGLWWCMAGRVVAGGHQNVATYSFIIIHFRTRTYTYTSVTAVYVYGAVYVGDLTYTSVTATSGVIAADLIEIINPGLREMKAWTILYALIFSD